jgi:hypothetical protein
MVAQTRVDGLTPHGGAYALLTYFDADRKTVPGKDGAAFVDVEEFTADGRRVAKTYMQAGPPADPAVSEPVDIGGGEWDPNAPDAPLWDLHMLDDEGGWGPVIQTLDQLFTGDAGFRKVGREEGDVGRATLLTQWAESAVWSKAPAELKAEAQAWLDEHRKDATPPE